MADPASRRCAPALEEGRLIESVFDAGEEPPDIDAPALVIVEADGTYIKAQREDSDRFEVKTG